MCSGYSIFFTLYIIFSKISKNFEKVCIDCIFDNSQHSLIHLAKVKTIVLPHGFLLFLRMYISFIQIQSTVKVLSKSKLNI